MSFDLNRDGLAGSPDNHARTGCPPAREPCQEHRHNNNIKYHAARTETRIRECLASRTDHAPVLFDADITKMTRNELADLLFEDVHGAALADILTSEAARDALIKDLAQRTGEALATRDVEYEYF